LEALADQLDPIEPDPPPKANPDPQGGQHDYTVDQVAQMLTFVRKVDDRERWMKVGMSLKSALGEAGRAPWDSWSRQSSKFDAADQDKHWDSFKAGGGVTIGTLIYFAKEGGWQPPRRPARVVLVHTPRRKPNNQPAPDVVDERQKPPAFPIQCIRGTGKTYIEELKDRGEWPGEFLFAEWRSIHAMLMNRRVGLGAAKPRFAHCHDLIVGESGITHKNTSIGRTADIVRAAAPYIRTFNNVSSIEGVLEEMAPHKSRGRLLSYPIAFIAAGEYSFLVASQQRQATSNLIPVLNDAYDGVDPLTVTRKRPPIVHNSFLNLMTGCTPAWIENYADKEGSDLGRFNRFFIFYAAQDRDMPRAKHLSPTERDHFAKMFSDQINKVAGNVSNQLAVVEFAPGAEKTYNDWFYKFRARLRGMPENLRKLLERNEDQAQIMALIYATADGRRLIENEDIESAISLVEWNQENKFRLFAEVEFSAEERLERLLHIFIDRGGGKLKELYNYLGSKRISAEAVHRKLRSFSALGFCELSRKLEEPGPPLEIWPSPDDEETEHKTRK
jgi:hypothetical protein